MAHAARVLLASCYELGHQPFVLAEARALLERAGHLVRVNDTAIDAVDEQAMGWADLIAISVPMLTAQRLGVELARRARELNPRAHVCLFGLYAWENAQHLLETACDSVTGGECEPVLVELATRLAADEAVDSIPHLTARAAAVAPPRLAKVDFLVPNRAELPALERYARLLGPAPGEQRVAGYLEASRGCRYRCRHCPVVPVYDGRFFVVPQHVVAADARQQVEAGARHLGFGDPDFFNGVGHAMRVARELHRAHPDVSFDVTLKVEHVLRYRDELAELGELGCVFVQSAVESLSDRVLAALDKGHTRADVFEALEVARSAGVALRPSFVPFTPWATLDDTIELVDFVFERELVGSVDPIQLTIRLLVPPGSALLWEPGPRPAGSAPAGGVRRRRPSWLGELLPEQLTHHWAHGDPRMDRLARQFAEIVERSVAAARPDADTLLELRAAAYAMAEREPPPLGSLRRRFVPRSSESWFCCAEPSRAQREQIAQPACCGSSERAAGR